MLITKKDILILGKGPTQGVDNTTLTAEAEYSINFTKHGKTFCLSLRNKGSSSYLSVNVVKIYEFE